MTFIPVDASAIGPHAPGAWPEISDSAFRVYVCLLAHANRATGQCNPSTATLARECGKHRGSIYRALESLESAGWIGITKQPGGRNSYTLPPIPTRSASATSCTGATSSAGATPPVAPARQNLSRQRAQNKKKEQEEGTKGKRGQDSTGRYDPLAADLPYSSERFTTAWSDFVSHRRSIRHPLTEAATTRILRKLAAWGEDGAVESLDLSIENGWRGVFEPGRPGRNGPTNGRKATPPKSKPVIFTASD